MATSSGEQGELGFTILTYSPIDHHQVEISSLSLQQLGSVKKQLDDELEHLTISFQKLRSAQSKFRDCGKSVQNGINPKTAGKVCHGRLGSGPEQSNAYRPSTARTTHNFALYSRHPIQWK